MNGSDSHITPLESETPLTRRCVLASAGTLMLNGWLSKAMSGLALGARDEGRNTEAASPGVPLPTDRWIEIDINWFTQENIPGAVEQFWDRFFPLYTKVQGYRGVIVNLAWTVGPIMEWSGNLEQKISLPSGSVHDRWQAQGGWVEERGLLVGTTDERMREAAARFAKPANVPRRPYGVWTYGDLKTLIALLKQEGARRDIGGFKVGTFNVGGPDIYGEKASWSRRHPEAYSTDAQFFDPNATLNADATPLGGLPQGIAEGMAVYRAYAVQWGSLSRAIGLDAILFRDQMGLPVAYRRAGAWGPLAPAPEIMRRATEGMAALVRDTKLANPDALVMMYSNGASAVGDWRANGLDVETIAKQGHLDVWIDQTWAGAWNEVGLRETDFWNSPLQGWTYQLGYMLVHAAILAETKVRHYSLVETFDAWEDWDVLHTAPERLRWGIWAYSHAAVKTPHGLKFPAGSYISWANQGGRLLDEKDVLFLSQNINAAAHNAQVTTEVLGPTMVYSRSSMQWQADHASAGHDINEWIDEQVFSAAKWPLPVLSVTRSEWLPLVDSDLFIVQAPSHLQPHETATIKQLIEKGQPIALFGNVACGIDPELARMAGLSGDCAKETDVIAPRRAEATSVIDSITENLPQSFNVMSRGLANRLSGEANVVYFVNGNPVLLINRTRGRKLIIWDPPELVRVKGHPTEVPLSEIWGNTGTPYALAAAALTTLLAGEKKLHASKIDLRQTMSIAAWKTMNGAVYILAGNLEEGLRDDADGTRHATLDLPGSWPGTWQDVWTGESHYRRQGVLRIDLAQAASALLRAHGT
ncbi:MAG TPA: hypothetical protein VHX20_10080 [Terracidiphilus sp.]|nr:hypothetical protein [Terracidiphilus sp.]